MRFGSARFVGSYPDYKQAPRLGLPEIAIGGRSNVGKSSLINLLTGKKGLAKISSTPGKTQLINYFLINDEWYLVDLPGYGFAKKSKVERKKWELMIHKYLSQRKTLVCTFILVDCRHEPQKIDVEFINWVGATRLPFVIVFTKIDKLSKLKLKQNIDKYKDHLKKDWQELPQFYLSSIINKSGKDEILEFIENNNRSFKQFFTD